MNWSELLWRLVFAASVATSAIAVGALVLVRAHVAMYGVGPTLVRLFGAHLRGCVVVINRDGHGEAWRDIEPGEVLMVDSDLCTSVATAAGYDTQTAVPVVPVAALQAVLESLAALANGDPRWQEMVKRPAKCVQQKPDAGSGS